MASQIEREKWKLLHSVEKLMEGPMIFLAFAWLVLMVVEFIFGLTKGLEYLFLGIWILFIIDFFVKFFIAPKKLRFLKKNWLTAISLFIPALRVFRVLRFVRVLRGLRGLRLVRVVSTMNRSMRTLAATMQRRAFGYVFLLAVVVTFAGAAGLYAFERPGPGFTSYGTALWWTAMRVITAGSEYSPQTTEGRLLAFMISLFGYAIFGYVTATLATFFIGRDAEEDRAPIAGSKELKEIKAELKKISLALETTNYKSGEQRKKD